MMSHAPHTVAERRFVPSERAMSALRWGALGGGAVFLLGLFMAPERVWGGYLMGFVFLTALALAGPVFIAFLTMAGARWSVALQRVPECMAAALPAAAALGVGLLFGIHTLYEWSHEAVVEHDALLAAKAGWLNTTGFALRLLIVFALWIVMSRRLVTLSRERAHSDDEGAARRLLRASAVFMIVVALSFSVASVDWLKSLEPHWFSTMFALMHFGGLAAVGLAAAILLCLLLENQGALSGVLREDHLHDMGKLLFALTLFWAYCWYCQYMLIWYTDIPEETVHYTMRKEGAWWLLVQAALVLKWGVPFLALMARRTCRNRKVLAQAAACVLVGHGIDLFVQVGPPLMGAEVAVGLWELGPLLGAVCLFFLLTLRALARTSIVPQRHPHLPDSLSYHTP
jgi:hypothetical protein